MAVSSSLLSRGRVVTFEMHINICKVKEQVPSPLTWFDVRSLGPRLGWAPPLGTCGCSGEMGASARDGAPGILIGDGELGSS